MGLAGTAKEPEDFRAGDVNIYEAQTGDGAPEIRLFPHVFERWKPSGEVIQAPDVHPWEDDEEEPDFEGKDRKAQAEQARSAGERPSRFANGARLGIGSRSRFRRQGHANSSP